MTEIDDDLRARQPLASRTVLITRAAHQAPEFARELEAYGARVLSCPLIEIAEPETYDELDRAIEDLWGYDWVIFTSANGVDHFTRRLEKLGRDVIDLDDLRVCAIGAATADRLRDRQIHADIVPQESKAEGVFAALRDYLGGAEAFAGLAFLIPRAAVAREHLPQALRAAGARVDAVAAYRTILPADLERTKLEARLVGGAIDCVAFTSGSTVRHFARVFGTTDLRPLLEDVRVACIGDITAQTAAEFNLDVDIHPAEFNTHALAREIARSFDEG